MIIEAKSSWIIRLYGQLKCLRKTAIQASDSKDAVIRVPKNRKPKKRKKITCPEDLSVRDKRRIRRTARQLIRYEVVISCITKNKTGVTASRQTICRASAKQDFSFERIKKRRNLGNSVSSLHTDTLSNSWTSSKWFSRMRNAFALRDPATSVHMSTIAVIASSHRTEWSVKWVVAVSWF